MVLLIRGNRARGTLDMKTIKTRNLTKGIKVLERSIAVSRRMTDAAVKTKSVAEETQDSSYDSPADYAIAKVQGTAQDTMQSVARRISPRSLQPRQKVEKHWGRAKEHFKEFRQQMPKARQRAAAEAEGEAVKTRGEADKLKNVSDKARGDAQSAKKAVKDAKQTLREVRKDGRQTLREVKQKTRADAQTHSSGTKNQGNPVKRQFMKGKADAGNVSTGTSAGNTRMDLTKQSLNPSRRVSHTSRTAKSAKSTMGGVKQTAKGTIKTAQKSVKTAERTAKTAVKTAQKTARTAQQTAKAAAKAAKIAEKTARVAAKAAVQATKAAAQAVVATVKAIIAAIQGLIEIIAAGGWIAVLVILVTCVVGAIICGIFGIFFANEINDGTGTGMTINSVLAEIDNEFVSQIEDIQNGNTYDLLDMSGARVTWRQVLAVYTVRTVTDPDNPMDVATMDDTRAALLRAVFWDMHDISYVVDSAEVVEDVLDGDGLPTGETATVTKTVLRITIAHTLPDEIAVQYGFDSEQLSYLEELLKSEYISLWNALLYGVAAIGDGSMIGVAETQLGNIGGTLYWSWFGFTSRVEWCAIFVSWVAEQCGYIDAGIVPRFSGCQEQGIPWFQVRGQWQGRDYTPKTGDIIFFDWENDGWSDHVGIVERVESGVVYTIEGNTSDSVARRSYSLNSNVICGYGVPVYP